MESQSEDRKYARGPLDTPSHRIGSGSLAPDSSHFAKAHPRTGSKSVLRNPGSRSGNDQQHVGQRDWRRSTGDQHGLAGQIQGFYAQIRTIFQIPIATATLQNPRQLESILLSRSPGQIPNTTGGYAAVYGVVPTPQNAPPPVRDIIDMTDAVAQDAMERAIAIDAIADQELAAADQINTNVQSATPGSAPIIEAQADAWLVRAHAYTQSALADLMRVRAIDLANNGAHLKLGSAWAVTTQQNVSTTLQHK